MKRTFLSLVGFAAAPFAAPFTFDSGLLDQSDRVAAGLSPAPSAETFTVFSPTDATDHYANGVVMASFKGRLYCQWQSSATDEDSDDTWVAYSVSADGETWSAPKVLAESPSDGHRTSGGWWVNGDTLIAYVNEWPDSLSSGGYAYYRASVDGENWTEMSPVLMRDGSPMAGIVEQDFHRLPSGRILGAAHFLPGLLAAPVYSDDSSGVRGFVKGEISMETVSGGAQTRGLEPSLFVNSDGNPVMVFRDQQTTFQKLAAESLDDGGTWSAPEETGFPDSRAKQSAGNLPDGSAYMVSNPVDTNYRVPLAIVQSADGKYFDKAFSLRTGADLQKLRYEGKAKRVGYHYPKSMIAGKYLYVAYATNKEDVEYTRVPLEFLLYDLSVLDTLESAEPGIPADTVQADTSLSVKVRKFGASPSGVKRRASDALGRRVSPRETWILKF